MKKLNVLMFVASLGLTQLAQSQVLHLDMEDIKDVKGHTPLATAGVIGNAIRFDGYSNYLQTNSDLSACEKTGVTFSLWCALETYPMMVGDGDNKEDFTSIAGNYDKTANTGIDIEISNRGNYRANIKLASGLLTVTGSAKLPKYQWNNIIVTLDEQGSGRKATLYVNGEQVGQTNAAARAAFEYGSTTFTIAKSNDDIKSDNFLLNAINGIVDEITIYAERKEASWISTHYYNNKESALDLNYPAEYYVNDPIRPIFHGMPSHGWTNESHGMTYYNGKYHVFFQKNGNGPYMSRLHWGHIVSDDLCSWTEVKTAVDPADSYDIKGCWSGCIAEDEAIFGNKPGIIYTGVDWVKAMINFATPEDEELLNWTKASNNPRINGKPDNVGLSDDFRDPYLFRTENGAYIIVGSSNSKNIGCCTLHKYNNGNWESKGLFFEGISKELHGRFWEMPTVTKMSDGQWLFTCTPLDINGGVKVIYWVGSINADGKFEPASGPKTTELNGMAKDGYCMLSPTIYQKDGKTIALGIVPDKISGGANAELGYAHCYSLPREWTLDVNGNLLQKPASQVLALRGTEKSVTELKGRQIEVKATFQVADNVGIELLKKGDKSAKITYNHSTKNLTIDFSELQSTCYSTGMTKYSSSLPETLANDASITIDAWLDGSILDVFINDNWATSVRVFCKDAEANGAGIIGNATEVKAWELKPGTSSIEDISANETISLNQNSSAARFVVENGWVRLYNGQNRVF